MRNTFGNIIVRIRSINSNKVKLKIDNENYLLTLQ